MQHIKKQLSFKRKLLFTIIACFGFFIITELLFRVYFLIKYHRFHTSVYIQGGPLQTWDKDLVFINTPFYLDYKNRYQNNESGFKSKPGEWNIVPKNNHDFWVLLTGASAMEGMGSNKDGDWLDITGVEDYPYNKTIAFKLQGLLQAAIPGKKVKVFNGANSMFTLWQSYTRYNLLKEKLKPDWVISMDGMNEFVSIEKDFNVKDEIHERWNELPIFKFPSKYIIPVTRYSYSINALKQFIYHFKNSLRLAKNEENNYPVKTIWLNTAPKTLGIDINNERVKNAAAFYLQTLHQYDSVLTHDGVKHLLVYQPYLFNKNYSGMNNTEKALFNYYTWHDNDSQAQGFKVLIKNVLTEEQRTNINMWVIDGNIIAGKKQVFVDYCHFTETAADSIAVAFKTIILKTVKK